MVADQVTVDQLVGLVMLTVGSVRSRVMTTVPVMTVLFPILVNVVSSVLTHSLAVSIMFVFVEFANVPANVHCVSPWMTYPAGSVTYTSPFTNGVFVYSDENCNRALNPWLFVGGGVCVCVHCDGCPLHCRHDSI